MGTPKRSRRGASIELLVLVVGVLGLVVALLTQLSSAKLIALSGWKLISLSVLGTTAAAGGAILTWRKEQRSRQLERTDKLRTLLVTGDDWRRFELPAVTEVDPYWMCGVSASNYDQKHRNHDPYVRRARVDDLLDGALRDQHFVLLVGKSAAGKTRTAFEAVRRVLPEARLLIPQVQTSALAELIARHPPLRVGEAPVVIWLDDLERYVSAGAFDVSLLHRIRELAARVIVLAMRRRSSATAAMARRSARSVTACRSSSCRCSASTSGRTAPPWRGPAPA